MSKKKLIYIANSRMPATLAHGLQVMQMCAAFVASGYTAELVLPRRVNSVKENIFEYYGIAPTFSVSRIWCIDLIWWNNSDIFFWIQTVSFLICAKIVFLFRSFTSPEPQPHVLYTREQFVGFFWKKFILEMHALPKTVRPFHLRIWEKAEMLVVLTPFIREKLITIGIDGKKIHVAPDGVDLEKFDIHMSRDEARDALKLPKDLKLVGYVGMLRTLGMEKGIDTALEAMKQLSRIDTQLVLVGGHPDDIAYYQNMSVQLGITDRLLCIGRVPHARIPQYLKALDVLIAPFPKNEHYSYYMSPLKIFEYMASKRPIISTHLPSLEGIVGTGEALLVTPGNAGELAQAIEQVLTEHVLADTLSQKAFTTVQHYTWTERARTILKKEQTHEKNN